MKPILYVMPFLLIVTNAAYANADDPCKLHISKTDGNIETCWSISSPAGPSDYVNVRYDYPGPPQRQACGMSISVCDFGAASSYPIVGLYPANTALDPFGNTPDLSSPLETVTSPPILGGPVGDFCYVPFSSSVPLQGAVHAVAQFPPGSLDLLVGLDQDSVSHGGDECAFNPWDSTYASDDSYSTFAFSVTTGEAGLNIVEDPDTYLACANQSLLRIYGNDLDMTGDYEVFTAPVGSTVGLSFFAEAAPGDTCFAWLGFGPPIPMIDSGNGYCCLRISFAMPAICPGGPLPLQSFTWSTSCGVKLTNQVTLKCP